MAPDIGRNRRSASFRLKPHIHTRQVGSLGAVYCYGCASAPCYMPVKPAARVVRRYVLETGLVTWSHVHACTRTLQPIKRSVSGCA